MAGYTKTISAGPFGSRVTTWRLDGVEEVMGNINAKLADMKLKSAAGLVQAARLILNDADSGTPPLVPQRTGNLRSSRFIGPKQFEARVGSMMAEAQGLEYTGGKGGRGALDRRPSQGDPYVIFGYAANYAAAVHEMMMSKSGNRINWTRPNSGPKFLEASIKRNTEKVLAIIAKYAEL